MLLENWSYYKESNQLLRNLLYKTGWDPERCSNFYLEHMKGRENVTYPYESLLDRFRTRMKFGGLLEATKIPIYKKDIEYVQNSKRDFNLTTAEMRVLFGVIFMTRLYTSATIRLDTSFKMSGFVCAFDEPIPIVHVKGARWAESYNTIDGLPHICECGLLKRTKLRNIGCYYTYPNFAVGENDEVAYEYEVTLDSNRLNISKPFRELINIKQRYCLICGEPLIARCNNNMLCDSCAEAKERYRIVCLNNDIKLDNKRFKETYR